MHSQGRQADMITYNDIFRACGEGELRRLALEPHETQEVQLERARAIAERESPAS